MATRTPPTWTARAIGRFYGTSVQPIRRLVRDGILHPLRVNPRLMLFTDIDVLNAEPHLHINQKEIQ